MKTFRCDFGGGVSCEMQVEDSPPTKGSEFIREIRWTGEPCLKRILRSYIAWVNSVNKTLADEWQLRFMHVFQPTSDPITWQYWVYEPGRPPKRRKPKP